MGEAMQNCDCGKGPCCALKGSVWLGEPDFFQLRLGLSHHQTSQPPKAMVMMLPLKDNDLLDVEMSS